MTGVTTVSRRKFLQLGSVLALAVSALPLSEGCATFNNVFSSLRREELSDHAFTPATVKLAPFSEYHPAPSTEKLTIGDSLLEAYVTTPVDLNELYLMISGHHVYEESSPKNLREVNIADYAHFQKEVLAVAAQLGASEMKIRDMPVPEAVLLSGRIVAKKLEYNQNQISEKEKELYTEDLESLFYQLLSPDFGQQYPQNEEAKKTDSSAQDQVFENGQGVCRNYAGVNVAVFEVLKNLNPKLKNTYLKYYTPDGLGHGLRLWHAWNQVITLTRNNSGLEVQITYVDPTWLDTKKRTADNTGEKLGLSDEEAYEALDQAHFGKESLLAYGYLAELYETLGEYSRGFSPTFPASEAMRADYLNKAFLQRIDVCQRALDVAENNLLEFEKVDAYFTGSFKKAVEDFAGAEVGHVLHYGLAKVDPLQTEQFQKLTMMYQRAEILVPDLISQRDIPWVRYDYSPSKNDPTGGKFDTTVTHLKTSLGEIYDKIRSEFEGK